MTNRTARAITALTLGAALLLSACGSEERESPPSSPPASEQPSAAAPSAEDVAALESVTWSGEADGKPTLTFTAPLTVTGDVSRVVTEGAGADAAADGTVWVRSVVYNGSTGEEFAESAGSWDAPELINISMAPAGHPLLTALGGKKVGTQSLYAGPFDMQDGTTVTAISALEVVDAPEPITLDNGMPTVTFDESGVPSITIQPGFRGPEDLITQVLSEGDGPVVESGQTVTVNYSGWLQSTGTLFDSSWERGAPFDVNPIGGGKVIAGWDQGIVGQKVGSKLLLVIPSDLAYGPNGNSSIPGGASLIFVVEILAAK